MGIDVSTLSDDELDSLVKGSPPIAQTVAGSGPRLSEDVDRDTGAGFMERIAASFKSSPESAANFYRSRYGVGNVRVRNSEVEFVNPTNKKWTQADPRGMDWGDVADLAGDAPEVIFGALGGILGGTTGSIVPGAGTVVGGLGGAAGGTAIGNVFKQIVGSALPGEDVEKMSDRAIDVVKSGALGAVGEGVGKLISQGILKPIFSRMFRSAVAKNPAGVTEARAIERSINKGSTEASPEFRFLPGEETGSRPLLISEDVARTGISGSEYMYEAAQNNLRAMQDKALRIIDDVRGGARPMSDMNVGTEIKKTFDDIGGLMQDSLESRAAKDFEVLINPKADTPVFGAPKLKAAIESMIEKDTNSIGMQGARAEGAAKLLDELPETLSVKDIQLYLTRLGRVGYGKGDKGFMERLGDTDRAKDARRLFSVLSEDLEDLAAREGTRGSGMAKKLLAAKNNFAKGLAEMDQWQNSYFQKVIGDFGPESQARVMDNLRKLNGDELKSMMTVVNTRPEIADQVRANWIDTAMQKAVEVGKNRAGAAAPWFNAKTFLNNLGDEKQLQAMFGKTSREALADITMLQRAVARMSDRAFVGESPSAGRSFAMRALGDAFSPTQWPSLARELLVPWRIAQILTRPGAREQLERIASAKAPTRRVVAALTYLTGANVAPND